MYRHLPQTLLICASLLVSLASAATAGSVQRHARFQELSPDTVRPQGWLAEALARQVSGMSGHREVHGYPFDTCLWSGEIPRQGTHGLDWWRYEQTAYLVDGLTRLAHVTGNRDLLALSEANMSYVVTHPHADGRLGPVISGTKSEWPMAVFFRAAYGEWLATRDQRIVEAFARHYRATTVEQLSGGHRHICNIEGVLQTYAWTGDASLLEKARDAYARFSKAPLGDEVGLSQFESDARIVTHGVTWAEELKLPAILYIYTGEKRYLAAAENAVRKTERDHLLVDGVPSSNEYLSGKDPLQSHETCVISDYTWSLGYLLMATGDAAYADRIERAVFNAGLGAVSKNFRNLQYFSSPNQFTAGKGYDQNEYKRGGTWNAYQARHETECCAGNVHRILPNFAGREWMLDGQDGLAAVFYAPSAIEFPAQGRRLRVEQETEYPFSDTVVFRFHTDAEVSLPFTVRVPGWCASPELSFNGKPLSVSAVPGTFVRLPLTVREGDSLRLRLPMRLKLARNDGQLSLERGPLVFSYAIPEKQTVRWQDTHYPAFPALDLVPDGPWAYALAVDEDSLADRVKVVEKDEKGAYPFDPGASPVELRVPVRRVENWTLDEGRYTAESPLRCALAPETETLALVPYGSTRLRLTCFPEAVTLAPLALTNWRLSPAYPFDGKQALVSQKGAPETGSAVAWKELGASLQEGRLDLAKSLGALDGFAYVSASVQSEAEGRALLALHAKDSCVVYLNGVLVADLPGPRKLEEQPHLLPVVLRRGENSVLVKVAPLPKIRQHRDGWRLRLECLR